MKVLVTGREGQLVRSLVERGRDSGFTILPVGRPALDLEDSASVEAAIRDARPDIVINAAAYTAVDAAEDEPERAFRINAEAAGEVAAAARLVRAPIIQISTDYVFDGSGDRPYREGDETNPIGVYGRSKLVGEQRVRDENPDHLIVRTAWVYSPFGKNFLRTMMALAESRDTIRVVADQRGNPSSALDIADGLLACLRGWRDDGGRALGRTYHLAGSGAASWFEFAEQIFTECGRRGLASCRAEPIATTDWPTRAARPANSMLDSSAFASDFGFVMPDWKASTAAVIERLAARGGPASAQ